ncbi:GDP-Man:Man(3)GlcNAc(2)-PP-Dol alpha-1,2-mannosyltransferase-like [Pomacea canaliculata]|nr:GDP-Man:Man(3)GlcNAc(2)-PP-Dol alpha-1,2-mannosyltransferase-like [Pomacea canaliculata]XP_025084865.1 GDP-Man:Man(3)GlcNAc(2)-PP-Dol alpha-1,2-mannosyltransferase-like [Pomacea canaliculata]
MTLSEFMRQYVSVVSQVASLLILSGIFFIGVFALVLLVLRFWVQHRAKTLLPHLREGGTTLTVGFFHPYCNAGGGGERVLWTAIRAIQKRYPRIRCVVYTGDIEATPAEILGRAQQRFNITLPGQVEFIFLRHRGWVEACKYPCFTLLGQSLGSVVLGWEAIIGYVPDIYIDSMGYAFTVPIFRFFGGCKVACYVHYPTISTDMLERVSERTQAHNNISLIANSSLLSSIKLIYYRLFAYLYGVVGKRSQIIMVNSTWTFNHILQLWRAPSKTHIVYPPCDVSEFISIPLTQEVPVDEKNIISVGQFRPEKDHPLMLRSFKMFLEDTPKEARPRYKLLLVGSCRNDGDMQRVTDLKRLSEELSIQENVVFHLNVSFTELKQLLASSVIGLHTMWNEHFGIGVVECMASGTIVLAHNSGGPKLDIVIPYNNSATGFLASTEAEYARAMKIIFTMNSDKSLLIRQNARNSVARFSEEEFETNFLTVMDPLFNQKIT